MSVRKLSCNVWRIKAVLTDSLFFLLYDSTYDPVRDHSVYVLHLHLA